MNWKELRELIEIVSEKGFAEFEIERQGFRLRINNFRAQSNAAVQPPAPAVVVAPAAVELPTRAIQSDSQREGSGLSTEEALRERSAQLGEKAEGALHVIKSPIVGTFFRATSPTSEPFVKVGDHVQPETVVCIIEAMKLMNEIQAEASGEIVQIFVENGKPVEYDQPLFAVKI